MLLCIPYPYFHLQSRLRVRSFVGGITIRLTPLRDLTLSKNIDKYIIQYISIKIKIKFQYLQTDTSTGRGDDPIALEQINAKMKQPLLRNISKNKKIADMFYVQNISASVYITIIFLLRAALQPLCRVQRANDNIPPCSACGAAVPPPSALPRVHGAHLSPRGALWYGQA